jgi:hypothetical protein
MACINFRMDSTNILGYFTTRFLRINEPLFETFHDNIQKYFLFYLVFIYASHLSFQFFTCFLKNMSTQLTLGSYREVHLDPLCSFFILTATVLILLRRCFSESSVCCSCKRPLSNFKNKS